MTYERLAADIEPITGWLTAAEGAELFDLASTVDSARAIVEIGSHAGRSTTWLVEGAAADGVALAPTVFCVDSWEDAWTAPEIKGEFVRNMAPYVGRYVAFHAWSWIIAACWMTPIGLLFLDAQHEEEPTLRDFDAWSGWVVPDGVVAFHDDSPAWPGVGRAIGAILESGGWIDEGKVDSLRVLRREPVAAQKGAGE